MSAAKRTGDRMARGLILRLVAGLSLILLASGVATAQSENKQTMIDYTIGWERPNAHLFGISIQAPVDGARSLDFALPNWRPGLYAIQNYARNVQEFSATDEAGKPLSWNKL